MSDASPLAITSNLQIPAKELRFTFARSSGRGGQHVNKVNTRVTLWFDVAGSNSLTPEQKKRIRQVLGSRINREGVLQITADRQRSQQANRREALSRFAGLLRQALRQQRVRRPTRRPRRAREQRLRAKKHRALIKAHRQRVRRED